MDTPGQPDTPAPSSDTTAPWRQHYRLSAPEQPATAHPNLAAFVDACAGRHAGQAAFTVCMSNGMNGTLGYTAVREAAEAFACYLRNELRLSAGTRVAVQMPNCLAYPVAAFGSFKAGCVLVNVNPLYTAGEMRHQLSDSGAEVLVVMDMFTDKLVDALDGTSVQHVVVASITEFMPRVVAFVVDKVQRWWLRAIPECPVAATPFAEAMARGRLLRESLDADALDAFTHDIGQDALALLQYTGGTTGVAKGAMLTHGNLLANIDQIETTSRSHINEGQECVITALPLYHVFAYSVNLLAFFKSGARNVLVPNPRPIRNLQRAIENYPVTWITGVNTLFNALLQEEWFTLYPPKQLKAAIAGGAALHAAVAERWSEVTGTPLVEGYGLTESSPVVTYNPLDGPLKPGSIGIPVPQTDIRIVADDGRDQPPGEPGELLVRGPQVMRGYWGREEATAEALRDGWLHTGDIAVMEVDGFLKIVDRKKDLILVSGFNVYPNEIEDCIARMDAVLEVAVIGLPDARSGEAVHAYIVPRASLAPEDVIAHCREYLTGYKVPKRVHFRDELPTSPIGKVLRRELRDAERARPAAEIAA